MNRRTIRIIIALGAVSMIGLVVTQVFWLGKAFELREREFNDQVTAALSEVARQIKEINRDSSAMAPVQQLSERYFVVAMSDTLHPYLLQSLLANEFLSRNIRTGFEYHIYDCFTDSLVFDGHVAADGTMPARASLEDLPDLDNDSHYFGVHFPDKQEFVMRQMGVWLLSSGLVLAVLAFFAYTIGAVLKQKRLSEMKTDFINNMTHEFKTPISTIAASAELLLAGALEASPEKRMRYYRMIRDENERLRLQVEKVLQMAQFDRKSIDLSLSPADLHDLIRKATAGVQLLLDERQGEISHQFNATGPIALVDSLHFTNIIRNLLDNAIKYCAAPPRIRISTENEADGIAIRVSDNGIGMPPQVQKEVFSKFYRAPTGDIHNVKGFGLGLYYVRSLTEAHGGHVGVSSGAEGSTFTVWLPKGHA